MRNRVQDAAYYFLLALTLVLMSPLFVWGFILLTRMIGEV